MKKFICIAFCSLSIWGYTQPSDPHNDEYVRHERKETIQQQQTTYESILISAFKTGNATKIASYFGENVDLSILENESLYSKSQAEQILKNFFVKHKPSEFTIVHKGKSGQSEYFIGELNCADAIFRVTINSKSVNSNKEITSLKIEAN